MPASTRSVLFARRPAFPCRASAPTRTLPAVPSVRTPPLAPTLSTPSAVKPDVPDCVGLDYTEHMPVGLSACQSLMFSRLRRYAASTPTCKLPGRIAPRLQTSLLIQTESRRSKSLRLRSLFAHFVRFPHPQDRNICVCLKICRSSRNVNRVRSLVLAIRALTNTFACRSASAHLCPLTHSSFTYSATACGSADNTVDRRIGFTATSDSSA
jgi:hypothetical protein